MTAGRALMIAKQQYLATTQVLNPYDEKVLQQVVFYGLPMYKLGGTIPATNQSVQAAVGIAVGTCADDGGARAAT